MKKLLPLLILILIGCSEPEPINTLILRNNTYYLKNSDKPYTGPVFESYSGKLIIYKNGKKELTYKDGKPLSKFNYYKNGQLKDQSTYKNGELDGLYKSYYENGQLKDESTYKNGELIWYKSYYENGQLKVWESFIDGELNASTYN